MSGYLLDTNSVSELVRPTPELRVMEWVDSTDEAMLYLSVLTGRDSQRPGRATYEHTQNASGSLAGSGFANPIRRKNRPG